MAIDYFYNPSFMSVFTVHPKHMHIIGFLRYWPLKAQLNVLRKIPREGKSVYCCQLFVFEIKLNANSKIKIKNFGKNLGKASVNGLKEADVHKTGRSSRCSVKTRKRQKAVLKNFAKITGKYMCCNLFNKITGGGGVGGQAF